MENTQHLRGRKPDTGNKKRDDAEATRERDLDQALADSFPASDPVASISTARAGAPWPRKSERN
jgi:hypothetical protein